MDKLDWSVVVLVITMILLSIFWYQTAHADYLALRLNKLDERPSVCIQKPSDYKDWYKEGIGLGRIYNGVQEWRYALENHTKQDWYYDVLWDKQTCDVNIKFFNSVGPNNAFGITRCYESYCDISIYTLSMGWDYVKGTVQHEFGHALGLGHRLAFSSCDFVAVILSGDIMNPQANKFQHITTDDLNALVYLYGYNGFMEPNNEDPGERYIIALSPNCHNT